jgi:hypothetical protein
MKMTLNVNGKPAAITADDPQMPLLYALRDDLGLHGPRFGCGLGQCGACTVHVDGKAIRSCRMPLGAVTGKNVVTLEGLGTPGKPHPLQTALWSWRPPQATAPDARLIARTMRKCVPHRQRLPASAALISSSLGFLLDCSNAAACMIMPLMQ